MDKHILKKVQCSDRIYFNESFKRSVCEEYLLSGLSKDQLRYKYDIRGKSAIIQWMRQYGYADTPNLVDKGMDNNRPLEPIDNSKEDLSSRIKELEKALDQAQLEKKSLELLIHVAESELKIDIRKKHATKRSKK